MYKKYIKRGGKKVGPYYYESVRLENGKIKTIYLGKKPDKKKLKIKLKKLRLSSEVVKKRKRIVSIPVETNVVRDALALAEIFGNPKIKKDFETNFNIKRIIPGAKDFDFVPLLFALLSIVYVFGFFFLEAGITGYSVAEKAVSAASPSSFIVLIGLANSVLAILILIKLRGGKS